MFGDQTGKTGVLTDPLKTELFEFIMNHGRDGDDAQIPGKLLPLLQDMALRTEEQANSSGRRNRSLPSPIGLWADETMSMSC
nr:unnamed protein product [Digitaria exilis]